MAAVKVVTLKNMISKQTQLARRPATFTIEARFGQTCFYAANLRNYCCSYFNLISNGV